jgi:hypothetical protein
MKFHISTILVILILVFSFGYLVVNFYLQQRAKRRLETLLSVHKILIEEKLSKRKSVLSKDLDDDLYNTLLSILRKEIDSLTDKVDKHVMKRTFERKNFNNQKRYAIKIFSEIGLSDSIKSAS